MSASRPRVAVLLHYDQDPERWSARHRAGEVLDATPYGYERAAEWADLVWARSTPEGRGARALRRRLLARLGFDIVHVWRNRRILASAEVIWTHTEREHLAVALWQRFRPARRRVPVIAQTVWLWDAWPGFGRLRRSLTGWLLRTHPVEAVHSRLNLEASRVAVPGRRVLLLPFGSLGLPPASTADGSPMIGWFPVLAVGNDVHRDWHLLAEVARVLPDVAFRVASGNRASRLIDWPANVTVGPVSSMAELAALYRSASLVALPLTGNLHASGSTVAIESVDAGVPVVASDAGGLSDYLPAEAVLVPVGDVPAFAAAVRAVLTDPPAAGAGPAERGLTQLDYVKRYVLLSRSLIAAEAPDPAVSSFSPIRI